MSPSVPIVPATAEEYARRRLASTPSICCLCLTADRQRLTDRAVKCFLDQTYHATAPGAWMLIYDTGQEPYQLPLNLDTRRIVVVYCKPHAKRMIGKLRNEAIDMATHAEIIVHWDSDDWSAPERLSVQVNALMESGANVTGFHNLLFADARPDHIGVRAWEYDYKLYKTPGINPKVIGTSLVYRRSIWQEFPFDENCKFGEDTRWTKMLGVKEVNGLGLLVDDDIVMRKLHGPLMIAEQHGCNTVQLGATFDEHRAHHQPEWRRAPEWDAYCRERLYP